MADVEAIRRRNKLRKAMLAAGTHAERVALGERSRADLTHPRFAFPHEDIDDLLDVIGRTDPRDGG